MRNIWAAFVIHSREYWELRRFRRTEMKKGKIPNRSMMFKKFMKNWIWKYESYNLLRTKTVYFVWGEQHSRDEDKSEPTDKDCFHYPEEIAFIMCRSVNREWRLRWNRSGLVGKIFRFYKAAVSFNFILLTLKVNLDFGKCSANISEIVYSWWCSVTFPSWLHECYFRVKIIWSPELRPGTEELSRVSA